jgi:Zn-dependent protease
MRDLMAWSIPVGRFFGIMVRLHLVFALFMVAIVLRGVFGGYGFEALLLQALLFVAVLLHEFGHCFAARQVEGDASEILMWPLGGLAFVDVPHTPRANFITVIWGPLVNLLLCLAAAAVLVAYGLVPPLNPFWYPIVLFGEGGKVAFVGTDPLYSWTAGVWESQLAFLPMLFARFFWVNWLLFLFNMLLIGFPMDGGRLVQCVLWTYLGFRRATQIAIYCGYAVAALLVLFCLVLVTEKDAYTMMMLFGLALFIGLTCWQHGKMLEAGMLGDESTFGYDFSQGYTSLERGEQPQRPPRKRRPNFIQRWLARRAALRKQREEEERAAEELRLDELLAKVQRDGKDALTSEERRFLERVSARYRNRNRS